MRDGSRIRVLPLCTATVLTLSWVMDAAPAIARIIEIGGLMLLAFLGAQMVRAPLGEDLVQMERNGAATITGAVEGFLMAFLNPKILVFQVAVLTQVLDPTHGPRRRSRHRHGRRYHRWCMVRLRRRGVDGLDRPWWMQRHETRVVRSLVGACSVWPSSSVSRSRQISTLA